MILVHFVFVGLVLVSLVSVGSLLVGLVMGSFADGLVWYWFTIGRFGDGLIC